VRLVLHADAVAEATAAGDWYESQRPGLGDDFGGEIERALEMMKLIVRAPICPRLYFPRMIPRR
jgi:hypothetical protein